MMNNRFFVEDTMIEDSNKEFDTLENACEYAFNKKQEENKIYGFYGTRYLVHIGYFNLEYAENFNNVNDYIKACEEILKGL